MDRKSIVAKLLSFLALALALGCFAQVAVGQTFTGTILGTVSDATGALIPDAKVVATNEATKIEHPVTTNSAGQFVVPYLPPGTYSVSVEKPGFKKKVVSGLALEVDQRAMADVVLELGEISQVVQVTGQIPLLQTQASSVGTVIENKSVTDLPLNGRQFLQLAFLVPGVHAGAPDHFNTFIQGISVSGVGGRETNNSFSLDGVDDTSINCGYFSVQPSVDAIQEFKIETNNYSAEFGRTGGVVVNVVTKSGNNQLHGSAYEFLRNKVLNARNFFEADRSEFVQNQWGVSLGGPIVLPHYNGKNRSFFFFNSEWFRQRRPSITASTVPFGPELTGDFSQAGFTIFDPLTTRPDPSNPGAFIRDPFKDNIIPPERINPVALKALQFYPAPNNPGSSQNFVNSQKNTRNDFLYDLRLDHQFRPKDTWFGRFTQSRRTEFIPGSLPDDFATNRFFYGKAAGMGWVHVISPTFINEARLGYNRLNFARVSPRAGTDIPGQLGIKGIPFGRLSELPIFNIGGFTSLGDIEPYGNIDNIFQIVDTLTKVQGRHSLKFGIDIRRVLNDYFITRAPSGAYDFQGELTAQPGQFLPNGLADFLLGLPTDQVLTFVGDLGRTRTTNFNAFIQDDWRVTPNLTINLGLRYELLTPPKDKFGRQGFIDTRDGVATYVRNAPLDNPIPGSGITLANITFPFRRLDRDSILEGDNNNFGPRVGFAYKLPYWGNTTVIRGGYGVSYAYLPFSEFGAMTQRLVPFAVAVTLATDQIFPDLNGFDFPPGSSRSLGCNRAVGGFDPNFHWGDVQQWSFDIQHQFKGNILLDLGYVGSTSHHLAERRPTNTPPPGPGSLMSRRPFPAFGFVVEDRSDVDAHYNGGTVRVEKRFSNNLSFLASYTYSKLLEDGQGEVFGDPGQSSDIQDPTNLRAEFGPSPADIRHSFTFSSVWTLPFGSGQRFGAHLPSVARFLASGWQFDSVVTIHSGFHLSVIGGAFLNTDVGDITLLPRGRPNQICNPNSGFQFSPLEAFNVNCFVAPTTPFTFGNAANGTVQGPSFKDFDLSFFKNNKIKERLNVQFRAEFFNAFNHANFGIPDQNFNDSTFGQVFSASDPRLIQLALKLIF